jgi:hypothetical protein
VFGEHCVDGVWGLVLYVDFIRAFGLFFDLVEDVCVDWFCGSEFG